MAIERKFVFELLHKRELTCFLEKELEKAGFAGVDIQKTPLVTRINVYVVNPGIVIGRKGRTIKDLTDAVQKKFKIENPQIAVVQVENENLNPRIVARKVAKSLEMGKNVRRILHMTLKSIMDSGALGAEIVTAGKLVGKGGRAKTVRISAGYIPKAGDVLFLVDTAHVTAYPKPGAIGVLVRIVPPGTEFPDRKVKKIDLPSVIQAANTEVGVSGNYKDR